MTTRIEAGGPSTLVVAGPTAARTTAEPARPFQQVMRASAAAIVAGAEGAATRLPGGPLLAAAFRPGPGSAGAALSPEGPGAARSAGIAGPEGAAAEGSSGIEGVLAQNADQNLYFIALQERISQENRHFTTISNVLKARHETVKNAIGNLR